MNTLQMGHLGMPAGGLLWDFSLHVRDVASIFHAHVSVHVRPPVLGVH